MTEILTSVEQCVDFPVGLSEEVSYIGYVSGTALAAVATVPTVVACGIDVSEANEQGAFFW